jgi:trehalose synthase
MSLTQVDVRALPLDRLQQLIGPERAQRFESAAATARDFLEGRRVVNVNSTATGGGVAEMLQTLLAYARGAGVDTRWVVIEGNPRFFEITKRLHNHLYGIAGDGGRLGVAERRDYDATLRGNAAELLEFVEPGDIVVLHDPQTAGLSSAVQRTGSPVVWRCHVGIDSPNERSETGWEFLHPYLDEVRGFVFSREKFAPAWVPRAHLDVIAPSIDPFSGKNEALDPPEAVRILQHVGLLAEDGREPISGFARRDGTRGRITGRVDLLGTGPPPSIDVPVVLQASRWDTLKDMDGVMAGFAEHVVDHSDAHLILAGPQARGVADDPEASQVLDACLAHWKELPEHVQRRVHLVCIPMDDPDEHAIIVNALQRHAAIAVQKSLAEGFGLTVAEAMWKARPVIGTAVGGIVDQIVSGETGVLLDDPRDLERFGETVCALLDDPGARARMGNNGRQRAIEQFLGDRHLEQWAHLFARIDHRN